MKILDITPITDSSEMPVKKGTLQFFQDAHKETMSAIIQGLIGSSYNPATVYILWGVLNTSTPPAYSISQGAAFYNGEVFYIDAAAFTATGSNVGVFKVIVTQYTTDADPVTFTDLAVRNVHNIRKLQIVSGASGSGIANYSQAAFLNLQITTTTITTPSSGLYSGNLLQVVSGFPNYQLFVPPSLNPNPILSAGSLNVGDVGGGGADFTISIPGAPLSTGNYYVVGTIISGGPNTRQDSTIQFSVRNRNNSTFDVHFEEFSPGVQNIIFEFMLFKK